MTKDEIICKVINEIKEGKLCIVEFIKNGCYTGYRNEYRYEDGTFIQTFEDRHTGDDIELFISEKRLISDLLMEIERPWFASIWLWDDVTGTRKKPLEL